MIFFLFFFLDCLVTLFISVSSSHVAAASSTSAVKSRMGVVFDFMLLCVCLYMSVCVCVCVCVKGCDSQQPVAMATKTRILSCIIPPSEDVQILPSSSFVVLTCLLHHLSLTLCLSLDTQAQYSVSTAVTHMQMHMDS